MKILDENIFLHGGDYYPDHWKDDPNTLRQDIQLLKEANINFVSLGVFSWSQLEPVEGIYTFDWLDDVIETLHMHGFKFTLATPSGAKPAWLATRYPESLRVDAYGRRQYHGNRHNHCITSPIYRQKVQAINTQLAQRYGKHPSLFLWHISNEFSGECFCDLCQIEFRKFLQKKYQTIDNFNKQSWHTWFSHQYNTFEQVRPPMPIGEQDDLTLALDWYRFTTMNTINFYQAEVATIRLNSTLPVTTNFINQCFPLGYLEFAKYVDIVAYDSYPKWHQSNDYDTAIYAGMFYDIMRSAKGNQPFLLLESTPSAANWHEVTKLKRPKMHALSSIQAIAHGSDMVSYFQVRKGRGQSEKYHSAIIDHDATSDNRVFQDVKHLGEFLQSLPAIVGSIPQNSIAIYFDPTNQLAINLNKAPRQIGMGYMDEVVTFYKALISQGYGVDFINYDSAINDYKLIILPMVYSAPDHFWQKIKEFTTHGGRIVSTYLSGYANENDLLHVKGRKEELSAIIGLEYKELDAILDSDSNYTIIDNQHFSIKAICEINKNVHAHVISTYGSDFYANTPLITQYQGNYHLAARIEYAGIRYLLGKITEELLIDKIIDLQNHPLLVTKRISQHNEYLFIMNFTEESHTLILDTRYTTLDDATLSNITLDKYEYAILKKIT